MRITPVNNTNFQGSFKKNKVLEKLLTVSDKETLGRFNDVLERANKVNDGFVYRITCTRTNNPLSYTELLQFTLNKEDTKYKYENSEQTFERIINSYKSAFEKLDSCSGVLKQFLPKLEKEYPKTDFQESNSELIEKINDKLI